MQVASLHLAPDTQIMQGYQTTLRDTRPRCTKSSSQSADLQGLLVIAAVY